MRSKGKHSKVFECKDNKKTLCEIITDRRSGIPISDKDRFKPKSKKIKL